MVYRFVIFSDEVDNFIKAFNTENEYNTIQGNINSEEIDYIRFIYKMYAELSGDI